MKKILLLTMTVLFSLSANSQTQNNLAGIKGKPASVKMKPMKAQTATTGDKIYVREPMHPILQRNSYNTHTSSTFTETILGLTQYDFQSYRSVGRRISNNGDGTLSTVWAFDWVLNHGIGYNYYDGTNWNIAPGNITTNSQSSFPTIDLGTSGEFITFSEYGNGVQLGQRITKGIGPITKSSIGSGAGDPGTRFALGGVTGDTIHVVTKTGITLDYSRSIDGGLTWIDDHIQIPGTGPAFMYGVGPEEFNIDARGDVVAVVIGGYTNDVVLLKSIDGGVTWTRTLILPFPLGPLYNPASMNTDTTGDGLGEMISSNAGDVTVTIDNNNICHVAFSHMFVVEDIGDTIISYYPADNTGLNYWHEGMISPVTITSAEDFDGNGFINIPINPFDSTETGFGLYNIGLVGQPSIGIASDNNIYIAYSAIDERADTTAWKTAMRHIFITGSSDGGNTWSYSSTINPSPDGDFQEAVWPSVATLVDSLIHIIYQRDLAPGHSLSNNTTQAANNILYPSEIVYAGVLANTIVNINETSIGLSAIDVFPIPSANFCYITALSFTKATLFLYDITGQILMKENFNDKLSLNISTLSAGMYFLDIVDSKERRVKGKIIRE